MMETTITEYGYGWVMRSYSTGVVVTVYRTGEIVVSFMDAYAAAQYRKLRKG